MSSDPIDAIANAVLYEGFMLYPYRTSSVKNRHRWNFGVLYPPRYSEVADGYERSSVQTECLFEAGPTTAIGLKLRFLQFTAEKTEECEIQIESQSAGARQTMTREISIGANLRGCVEARLTLLHDALFKVQVRLSNLGAYAGNSRDAALEHAFISSHIVLRVENGKFISSIDPPEALQPHVDVCVNEGLWPVLVGTTGAASHMLAAPIILGDYPRVAPQSPTNLFDGAEIDEILTLRIMTLTEQEKQEIRGADPRTRQMLENAESIGSEQLMNLHGVLNKQMTRPPLRKGDRVRLQPKRRADVFDIALKGKSATVESVEEDFENRVYITVTIDDDPGKDLGMTGQPGHRFFFDADEVEPL